MFLSLERLVLLLSSAFEDPVAGPIIRPSVSGGWIGREGDLKGIADFEPNITPPPIVPI